MLHQFTFKNYKSFRKETTLDLLATAIKEHPEDVVTDIKGEQVLKVGAIYGANASGKSNVIEAFGIMKRMVMSSFGRPYFTESIEPYWFEKEDVPTEFSVLFSTEQDIYQYGYSVLKGVILEGYLYVRDRKLKKEEYLELFLRKGETITGSLVESMEEKTILDLIEHDTLIVSVLSKLKIADIRTVYDWFRTVRVVDYRDLKRIFRSS